MAFESNEFQTFVGTLPIAERLRLNKTLQNIQAAICKGNMAEAMNLSRLAFEYYKSQYFSAVANG